MAVKAAIATIGIPHRPKPVTISGSSGEDAKPYQEKNVRDAIKDVQP
jgi:hypothetical protein